MKVLFAFIILLAACGAPCSECVPGNTDSGAKFATKKDLFPFAPDLYLNRPLKAIDTIVLTDTLLLSNYVAKEFGGELDGFTPTSIKMETKAVKIKGLGTSTIYAMQYAEEMPFVVPFKAYLIVSKEMKVATVLYLEDLRLIKISAAGEESLPGGFYQVKSKGFFVVYEKSGATLKRMFSTLEDGNCRNGIPVINKGMDCISYEPFELNFSNADIDNDGLNDLSFSGKINYYCEGLETNTGRNDREPLRSENVNITFWGAGGIRWILRDTTICRKISETNHLSKLKK